MKRQVAIDSAMTDERGPYWCVASKGKDGVWRAEKRRPTVILSGGYSYVGKVPKDGWTLAQAQAVAAARNAQLPDPPFVKPRPKPQPQPRMYELDDQMRLVPKLDDDPVDDDQQPKTGDM